MTTLRRFTVPTKTNFLHVQIEANSDKSGRKYAKHRPYTVPDWCQPLLDAALRDEDEIETKRIMLVVRSGSFTMV